MARALDFAVAAGILESVSLIERGLADAAGATPPLPPALQIGLPLPAMAVAAYFDLLAAVLSDDVERATEALGLLRRAVARGGRPFVTSWDDLTGEEAALCARHLNTDSSTRVDLRAPSGESAARAKRSIEEGLDLLDRGAPEVSGEIRGLIREILLVSGTVNGTRSFDGATVFTLWGALLLNADEHASRIEAVDGLVHESAHALLFGHSLGRPFVENDPDEVYASPLREDPRPLDGIFHATFVTARIHYAFDRLLRAQMLTCEETMIAEGKMSASRCAFDDGSVVLRRHARLTPLGEALLSAATGHMSRDVGG